jgi:hypothetical protein
VPCLPNTTYDLPAFVSPLGLALCALIIKSSKPSPLTGDGLDDLIVGADGAKSGAGKSYIIFGKQDNTTINLSDIAAGKGGFVI